MGLPSGANGTEGSGRFRARGCEHRAVGAREPLGIRLPDTVGPSPAARASSRDRVANVGPSVFRRLVGSSATDGPGGRATVVVQRAPQAASSPSPTQSLEAELAERLDTVLGIAGRLAARTIARSSSGRSSTRPSAPCAPTRRRSASCTTTASRSPPGPASPTTSPDACRSSVATRAGSARSCAPDTSWPGRTSGDDPSHGYERVRRRPRGRRPPDRAAHPPRPGASAPCRRSRASRATGRAATSRSSRRSRRTPRSP